MSSITNNSNVVNFNFKSHSIRVVSTNPLDPLFVAKDVAIAFGYKDSINAIKKHCKGVAKHHPLETDGGIQEVRVINETDLYRLIFGSKLKSAITFQDWVFEEVLPAIRKTGEYKKTIQTLTPFQQCHIQKRVKQLVNEQVGATYPQIWGSVKAKFKVGKYSDIPSVSYPKLCEYLKCKPLEGELIAPELTKLPARPITRLNFPERVTSLRYLTLSEMCDCGWSLQLNKMIRTIEQHEREGTDYRFDDISGLKQEIKSLCHLVEQQDMKIQNGKRALN